MKKYFREIMTYYADLCSKNLTEDEKNKDIRKLSTKIEQMQHERLVHLVVLSLFAICEILSLIGFYLTESYVLLALVLLFFLPLLPYVIHYYFLENGVQHLYKVMDEIESIGESEEE